MAARVGIDERYSDAITGHSPATTGRAYTKPLPEDLADALKKFPRYRLDESGGTAEIAHRSLKPDQMDTQGAKKVPGGTG
jgi:hypothetical protein